MDFIKNITSETLIICNNTVKELILNMHLFKPIKFMNKLEFLSKYFFTYDEFAIKYISDKYNIRYDIAKEYIDNLYYIEDKQYNNYKLDFLVNIKKELDNHKLLKYNTYFKAYLDRVKIIIYDVDIDNFFLNIIKNYNYEIINREYNNYNHKVYEFNTMEEEIDYIANKICLLIDSGINVKNIKLSNVDSSYYNTIQRIFSLYNLKVNIPYKTPLNSYPLVSKFIDLYKDSDKSFEEILDIVKEDNVIYNELVKVINKYLIYDDKDLLIYMLKNSYITSDKYDNGIDIINFIDYITNSEEYIFMIGFNEGLIPKTYQDTDYLSDNIKKELLLDDTYTLNNKLRKRIINSIKDIKNLTITYKLKDNKKSYYPSNLCSNFEVVHDNYDKTISYSDTYNKMKLVKYYDEYFKFGSLNESLNLLNNNYNIKYNSYDNKYTKINRNIDKLNLSYSKMNTYNKCAFRYYLDNVLKLNIYEENFSTIIGSMVHYVMEKCLSNNDMDTEKYASEYLKDKTFSKKENFFLKKYQESVKELFNQVLLEKEYYLFDKALYEEKISINYKDNVIFTGIIDKILYYIDNNKTYMALIDYKTGNDNISLKYFKYGIDIQLPIYLYLSSKLDFKNIIYTGFYLQKFNITDKDYRLVGYSNSNTDTLSIIDKEYHNSKIIKGLKTISDGSFSKTSKILSDDEIAKIKNKTEEIIKETINNINNNKFDINPKVDNGTNISCMFCKYKDICFKKTCDEVAINACDITEVI